MMHRVVLNACVLAAMTATAHAEWKTHVEYVATPGRSGIRILSTSGDLRVNVQGKSDGTPFVTSGGPLEAYVPVDVSDARGHRYRSKLEVRRGFETKLTIGWKEPVVTFTGTFGNNNHNCSPPAPGSMRYTVGRKTYEVAPGKSVQVTLPTGTYKVSWSNQLKGTWQPATVVSLDATKKDWSMAGGCKPFLTLSKTTVRNDERFEATLARSLPLDLNGDTYGFVLRPDKGSVFGGFKSGSSTTVWLTRTPPGSYELVLRHRLKELAVTKIRVE